MTTQTLQGALQQAIRTGLGGANDFNGDLHTMCNAYNIPQAPISGRLIGAAQKLDPSITTASAALNYFLQNYATAVPNPISLFSAGEQGAWYDPSDLTTLFQNAAGTTPVTAVEQAVGLILDKSKGLVLGPELVTNTGGPFINTTGWSGNQATLSVVSGKIRVTATATGFASAWIPITVPVGSGSVSINIVANNGTGPGAVSFSLYESPPSSSPVGLAVNLITSATNIYIFTTTDGNVAANVYFAPTAIGQYIEISSVSIKSLRGNHAYQSTDASRPTLRARYNLLTYSEDQSNAAWVSYNATQSSNAAVAPDGTTTADKIVEAGGSALQSRYATIANRPATLHTASCYFKRSSGADRQYANLSYSGTSAANWFAATFDLTGDGAVVKTGAGASGTYTSSSIVSVGNDWYRCSITGNVNQATNAFVYIGPSDSSNPTYGNFGVLTYAGNVANGIFVWGAQLLTAADNTTTGNAYQRIAAATDYVTTSTMGGYTFLPYLAFDGSDDSLLTNSVDFTGTDKMSCWVGVTKQDTDDYHCVVELGTDAASVAGTFNVWAPWAIATGYGFNVRGATNVGKYEPVTYSAPTTNVLFGGFNLAGATLPEAIIPRVNGVVDLDNPSATVPGGGNFINTPLYIGRRNNSTFPLNGRLYSLIVRGAASNATQISATEAYVASKTGVAL